VTPSQIPDQLDAVTTVVDNAFVKVSWTPTPDERGEPVTKYRILFYNAD